MLLTIQQFAGLAPKVDPVKLGDSLATKAHNVRLDKGSLSPWKGFFRFAPAVNFPASTVSIYPYNNDWLCWPTYVNVVGKITPNDVRDRIVFTGDGYPKIRSGSSTYRLGIPEPSPVTASLADPGDLSVLTWVRNQSYRVSFVDAWGAEGPLSDPSVSLEVGVGGEVDLVLPTVPVGNYNFGAGALIRIYRSNAGSQSSIWQFVDQVPVTTQSYKDIKEPAQLQEQAITRNWIGPPDDNAALYPDGPLIGLCFLPSGSLCGYSGNTVCLSEPFVPHAWPLDFRITIPDGKIMGIAPLANGLLVVTDKKPYMIQGSSPAAITAVQLDSNQACVSTQSLVDMGTYAIYASPDGLVVADGSDVKVVTEPFFTMHEWQDFSPQTIRAWQYEGKYIATYGSPLNGFIYDPFGDTASFTTLDFPVRAAYFSVRDDALYTFLTDGDFATFDDDPIPLTYQWQTKLFVFPSPTGLSAMRVEASGYPVNVTVYAEGKQLLVKDVKNNLPFRLPGSIKAKRWQVKIESDQDVHFFCLTDSMDELV